MYLQDIPPFPLGYTVFLFITINCCYCYNNIFKKKKGLLATSLKHFKESELQLFCLSFLQTKTIISSNMCISKFHQKKTLKSYIIHSIKFYVAPLIIFSKELSQK